MQLLLMLVVIWVSAKALGYCAKKIAIPPVLGELFAGILLGPSLLGWVKADEILQFLAEIGIVLLLFEVGLDTDLKRLHASGKKALSVACWGVLLPLLLTYGAMAFLFQLPTLEALFIGGTLTATSIGITVRVLSDLKQRHTHEAHIIIGAAILDDILGVLLLAVLYEFARVGNVSISSLMIILFEICMFMVLAPLLAKVFLSLVRMRMQKQDTYLFLGLSLVVLAGFSYLAACFGVPEIMAGFVVGLACSPQFGINFKKLSGLNRFLAKLFVPEQKGGEALIQQVKPLIHLFTPFFFVMVGVDVNLRIIPWTSTSLWLLVSMLFGVALLGKFCSSFFIREPWRLKIRIGTAMMPRGEVGLIFANLGLTAGVFSLNTYTPLVLVVALTTFFPPLLLRWLYERAPQTLLNKKDA